ncbi:MAG: flavin reductase family protein [Chloroflexi bacterium]|nr:flavin reductase family protein [Chloroflexota bacterium]
MKIELAGYSTGRQHEILGGMITPLPIALISTVGKDGPNAAPFSLVMPVSWEPPILAVCFGLKKGRKKRTVRNIEETGDFVVNIMGEKYIRPTIRASANYPDSVNKIEKVGLSTGPAVRVKSPIIKEATISIECKLVNEMFLNEGERLRTILFGECLLAHIPDELWVNDRIDPTKVGAIGRISENAYCRTTDVFRLTLAGAAAQTAKTL